MTQPHPSPADLSTTARRRASSWTEDNPLLHILPQTQWHDDAHIIGTREGLTRLRDAVNQALETGIGVPDGVYPSDGEGFWCIVVRATAEQMEQIPLGYADPIACGDMNLPDWVEDEGAKAVQKLLAKREQGPVA